MKLLAHIVVFIVTVLLVAGKLTREKNDSEGKHSKEKKDSVQIKYSYNPKYGCYFYNKEDQTVVLLGYISSTICFYNGKTGEAFVFVSNELSGVYFPPGSSDKTWISKNQSFTEYAKSLYPLNNLYHLGAKVGITFNAETIPKEMKRKLWQILRSQSVAYKDECNTLAYVMEIAKLMQTGRMNGFEHVLDKSLDDIDLNGDVLTVVSYYRGWKLFFGDFDGEMEALKNKNVKLDYEKLLKSETEFHLLVYILEGLAPCSDLVDVAKKRLNVEWEFFDLLGKFGGEVNYGFSGFLYVVSGCVRYLHGQVSEDNLAVILRGYFTNDRAVQDDPQKMWKTSVSFTVKKIKELKLDQQLREILKILQWIEKENWIIKDVDMYAALKIIWSENIPSGKSSVNKVLKALKSKKNKKY